MNMRQQALAALVVMAPSLAAALEIQPATSGVWALVGENTQRSKDNLANNATFGVVETPEGIVLIDPGGSWKGAAEIEATIRSISGQPARVVVNTGGQDHRWLGNAYWKAKGAKIIASEAAVEDQSARADAQLAAPKAFLGPAVDGTVPAEAEVTFADRFTLAFGGLTFEIVHPGPAHTPGDSFVWVPEKATVFTGDIVYVERLVGIGPQSSIAGWPAAFEAVAALSPARVVPGHGHGHGHATTLDHATADTQDYLLALRDKIAAHIAAGGDIIGAVEVDQSAFSHLEQFESLARRNAHEAFQQMEWE